MQHEISFTVKIHGKTMQDVYKKISQLRKSMRIESVRSCTPDATDTDYWYSVYGWKAVI